MVRGNRMKVHRIKKMQEEPAYVISKRKRRVKRILRAVRFFLVTALFAITIIYAALSPFFNIRDFKVRGTSRYDAAALAAASGIRTGRNGFRLLFSSKSRTGIFRIGDAENAILENCSYIKEAKVRYVVPSTISIEVTEREPAALIDIMDTKLLIDKDGYLLEIDPAIEAKTDSGANPETDDGNMPEDDNVPEDSNIPVIKTSNPGSAELGKKLDIPDEMLLSAFKVFDTIREADAMNDVKLLPLVDYVDTSDLSNIRFSLESRIIVNLGRVDELFYKINAAASIFTKNIKINERGTLDFSVGKDPVFTPESGG